MKLFRLERLDRSVIGVAGNVVRQVIYFAKFLDDDRFDFLFHFRLDMWIDHFHHPADTFTIVFDQEIGQDLFSHVSVLFAFSATETSPARTCRTISSLE